MFSKFISDAKDQKAKDECLNFLLTQLIEKTKVYSQQNVFTDASYKILDYDKHDLSGNKLYSDYYVRLMIAFYASYLSDEELDIDIEKHFHAIRNTAILGYEQFMKWWSSCPQGLIDITEDTVMQLKEYLFSYPKEEENTNKSLLPRDMAKIEAAITSKRNAT